MYVCYFVILGFVTCISKRKGIVCASMYLADRTKGEGVTAGGFASKEVVVGWRFGRWLL
jgi:hypothetical protein